MKEVMHLFILKTCTNNCPMCCNKLYNIDEIPVATVEELKEVHTVCFTGGEPFLYPELNFLAERIKRQFPNVHNIYAYSSGETLWEFLKYTSYTYPLTHVDGVSVAPKSKIDWEAFEKFWHIESIRSLRSNRLYVFDKDKDKINRKYFGWDVIGRRWDKTFNTPDNEIFRRLPILLD